jgi:hypothetical protein
LEYLDSADSPLVIDHFYADRHRQFHCDGAGDASLMDCLFAAALSLPAHVHRSVHVRAAVHRQVAQWVMCPKGDRVKMTMSGEFLPFKYYGARGKAQAYAKVEC